MSKEQEYSYLLEVIQRQVTFMGLHVIATGMAPHDVPEFNDMEAAIRRYFERNGKPGRPGTREVDNARFWFIHEGLRGLYEFCRSVVGDKRSPELAREACEQMEGLLAQANSIASSLWDDMWDEQVGDVHIG